MSYEQFLAAVVEIYDSSCPRHLWPDLWQAYDAGESVNDTVIRLRYRDACRKADRNA